MRYFKYFPSIEYDIDGNNQYRTVTDVFRMAKIENILSNDSSYYRYYDIQDGERPDHVSYRLYGTVDYHWTFFLLNPELKNVYTNWPLSQSEVDHMVEEKYNDTMLTFDDWEVAGLFTPGETLLGLISGARATYVERNTSLGWMRVTDVEGTFFNNEIIFGQDTRDTLVIRSQEVEKFSAHHYERDGLYVTRDAPNAVMITNWDYERELNDSKKQIRVIRPEHVNKLAAEFRKVINE